MKTEAAPIKVTVDHKAKDAREEKRWAKGDYPCEANTCYLCGRKAGTHWMALDLTNGTAVAIDYAMGEEDDTAFFPVGTTCKKGLPKTHLTTRKKLFPEAT